MPPVASPESIPTEKPPATPVTELLKLNLAAAPRPRLALRLLFEASRAFLLCTYEGGLAREVSILVLAAMSFSSENCITAVSFSLDS